MQKKCPTVSNKISKNHSKVKHDQYSNKSQKLLPWHFGGKGRNSRISSWKRSFYVTYKPYSWAINKYLLTTTKAQVFYKAEPSQCEWRRCTDYFSISVITMDLHKPSTNSLFFPLRKHGLRCQIHEAHTVLTGLMLTLPGTSKGRVVGKQSCEDSTPPGWTKLHLREDSSWANKSKLIPFCSTSGCFQRCLYVLVCLMGRWQSNGFNSLL